MGILERGGTPNSQSLGIDQNAKTVRDLSRDEGKGAYLKDMALAIGGGFADTAEGLAGLVDTGADKLSRTFTGKGQDAAMSKLVSRATKPAREVIERNKSWTQKLDDEDMAETMANADAAGYSEAQKAALYLQNMNLRRASLGLGGQAAQLVLGGTLTKGAAAAGSAIKAGASMGARKAGIDTAALAARVKASPVGGFLAKQKPGELAAAGAAGAAQSYIGNVGSVIQDNLEKGKDWDSGLPELQDPTIRAAVVSAVEQRLGIRLESQLAGLGKSGVKGSVQGAINSAKVPKGGFVRDSARLVKGGAKGFVGGAASEMYQTYGETQAVNRATGKDENEGLGQSMVDAGIMGGVFGGTAKVNETRALNSAYRYNRFANPPVTPTTTVDLFDRPQAAPGSYSDLTTGIKNSQSRGATIARVNDRLNQIEKEYSSENGDAGSVVDTIRQAYNTDPTAIGRMLESAKTFDDLRQIADGIRMSAQGSADASQSRKYTIGGPNQYTAGYWPGLPRVLDQGALPAPQGASPQPASPDNTASGLKFSGEVPGVAPENQQANQRWREQQRADDHQAAATAMPLAPSMPNMRHPTRVDQEARQQFQGIAQLAGIEDDGTGMKAYESLDAPMRLSVAARAAEAAASGKKVKLEDLGEQFGRFREPMDENKAVNARMNDVFTKWANGDSASVADLRGLLVRRAVLDGRIDPDKASIDAYLDGEDGIMKDLESIKAGIASSNSKRDAAQKKLDSLSAELKAKEAEVAHIKNRNRISEERAAKRGESANGEEKTDDALAKAQQEVDSLKAQVNALQDDVDAYKMEASPRSQLEGYLSQREQVNRSTAEAEEKAIPLSQQDLDKDAIRERTENSPSWQAKQQSSQMLDHAEGQREAEDTFSQPESSAFSREEFREFLSRPENQAKYRAAQSIKDTKQRKAAMSKLFDEFLDDKIARLDSQDLADERGRRADAAEAMGRHERERHEQRRKAIEDAFTAGDKEEKERQAEAKKERLREERRLWEKRQDVREAVSADDKEEKERQAEAKKEGLREKRRLWEKRQDVREAFAADGKKIKELQDLLDKDKKIKERKASRGKEISDNTEINRKRKLQSKSKRVIIADNAKLAKDRANGVLISEAEKERMRGRNDMMLAKYPELEGKLDTSWEADPEPGAVTREEAAKRRAQDKAIEKREHDKNRRKLLNKQEAATQTAEKENAKRIEEESARQVAQESAEAEKRRKAAFEDTVRSEFKKTAKRVVKKLDALMQAGGRRNFDKATGLAMDALEKIRGSLSSAERKEIRKAFNEDRKAYVGATDEYLSEIRDFAGQKEEGDSGRPESEDRLTRREIAQWNSAERKAKNNAATNRRNAAEAKHWADVAASEEKKLRQEANEKAKAEAEAARGEREARKLAKANQHQRGRIVTKFGTADSYATVSLQRKAEVKAKKEVDAARLARKKAHAEAWGNAGDVEANKELRQERGKDIAARTKANNEKKAPARKRAEEREKTTRVTIDANKRLSKLAADGQPLSESTKARMRQRNKEVIAKYPDLEGKLDTSWDKPRKPEGPDDTPPKGGAAAPVEKPSAAAPAEEPATKEAKPEVATEKPAESKPVVKATRKPAVKKVKRVREKSAFTKAIEASKSTDFWNADSVKSLLASIDAYMNGLKEGVKPASRITSLRKKAQDALDTIDRQGTLDFDAEPEAKPVEEALKAEKPVEEALKAEKPVEEAPKAEKPVEKKETPLTKDNAILLMSGDEFKKAQEKENGKAERAEKAAEPERVEEPVKPEQGQHPAEQVQPEDVRERKDGGEKPSERSAGGVGRKADEPHESGDRADGKGSVADKEAGGRSGEEDAGKRQDLADSQKLTRDIEQNYSVTGKDGKVLFCTELSNDLMSGKSDASLADVNKFNFDIMRRTRNGESGIAMAVRRMMVRALNGAFTTVHPEKASKIQNSWDKPAKAANKPEGPDDTPPKGGAPKPAGKTKKLSAQAQARVDAVKAKTGYTKMEAAATVYAKGGAFKTDKNGLDLDLVKEVKHLLKAYPKEKRSIAATGGDKAFNTAVYIANKHLSAVKSIFGKKGYLTPSDVKDTAPGGIPADISRYEYDAVSRVVWNHIDSWWSGRVPDVPKDVAKNGGRATIYAPKQVLEAWWKMVDRAPSLMRDPRKDYTSWLRSSELGYIEGRGEGDFHQPRLAELAREISKRQSSKAILDALASVKNAVKASKSPEGKMRLDAAIASLTRAVRDAYAPVKDFCSENAVDTHDAAKLAEVVKYAIDGPVASANVFLMDNHLGMIRPPRVKGSDSIWFNENIESVIVNHTESMDSAGMKSVSASKEGSTSQSIMAELSSDPAGRAVQTLLDNGTMKIVDREADLPDTVEKDGRTGGYYDPVTGKAYLVAENIAPGDARGVLLHEVGNHMVHDESMAPIDKRACILVADGVKSGDPLMTRVAERLAKAGETIDSNPQETRAYLTEEAAKLTKPSRGIMGFLRQMKAAVNAWMTEHVGNVPGFRLSPEDMVRVAEAGVQKAAAGKRNFSGKGMFSKAVTPEMRSVKEIPDDGLWKKVTAGKTDYRFALERGLNDRMRKTIDTMPIPSKAKDVVAKIADAIGRGMKAGLNAVFTRDLVQMAREYMPSAQRWYDSQIAKQNIKNRMLESSKWVQDKFYQGIHSHLEREAAYKFIADATTGRAWWTDTKPSWVAKDQWSKYEALSKDNAEGKAKVKAEWAKLNDAQKSAVEEFFKWNYKAKEEEIRALELANKAATDALLEQTDKSIKEAEGEISRADTDEAKKKAEDRLGRLKAQRESLMKRYSDIPKMVRAEIGTLASPYAPLRRMGDHLIVGKSQEFINLENSLKALEQKHLDDPAGYTKQDAAQAMSIRKKLNELKGDGKSYWLDSEDGAFSARSKMDALQKANPSLVFSEPFPTSEASRRGVIRLDQIKNVIDQAAVSMSDLDMDSETKDYIVGLSNAANELMIQSMMNSAIQKSQLKRRDVAGFETNMMRVFADYSAKQSSHVANLATERDQREALSAMLREKKSAPNDKREVCTDIYNQIIHRTDLLSKQDPKHWANGVQRFNAGMMLFTNPGYYFQNATQPFMMSASYMAGNFGMAKMTTEIGQVYGQLVKNFSGYFGKPWKIEDLLKDGIVSKEELEMLKQLNYESLLDPSMQSEYGELNDSENWAARKYKLVSDKFTAVNQRVEMMNRISTALVAYRNAKGSGKVKGMSEQYKDSIVARQFKGDLDAYAYTAEVIYRTHGDYSSLNSPAMMLQGGLKMGGMEKLLFQFRKYQMIQLGSYAHMLKQAFNGATPEERALGKREFLYTMGTHLVTCGIKGSFFLAQLVSVANWAFGDDDEDDDEFAKRMLGNGAAADILVGGLPEFAGLPVSSYIGAGDALSPFGFFKRNKNVGFTEDLVFNLAGPTASQADKMVRGFGSLWDSTNLVTDYSLDPYFKAGEFTKGMETILPKGFGNMVKAVDQMKNGIQSSSGNTTYVRPEEVTAWDTFCTVMGIPSSHVSEAYEKAGRAYDKMDLLKTKTNEVKAFIKEGDSKAAMRAIIRRNELAAKIGAKPKYYSDYIKDIQTAEKRAQ